MLPPFQPSNSRNFSIVNAGLPMIILNYSNSKAIVQIPLDRHGYRGIFHCCSRNSLEKRRDDCNLAPYLKTKPKSLRRAVFFKKPEKKISSYIYFFNSPSRNPISRIEGSYLYSLTSPKQSVAEKNLSPPLAEDRVLNAVFPYRKRYGGCKMSSFRKCADISPSSFSFFSSL